jgi:hypothetical protein
MATEMQGVSTEQDKTKARLRWATWTIYGRPQRLLACHVLQNFLVMATPVSKIKIRGNFWKLWVLLQGQVLGEWSK